MHLTLELISKVNMDLLQMVIGPSVSPCLVEKADTVGVTITHVMLISNPDSQDCK